VAQRRDAVEKEKNDESDPMVGSLSFDTD
jgi:hypothetical protein